MSTFKVAINFGDGRFGLSKAALTEYKTRIATNQQKFNHYDYFNTSFRSDPILIQIIEEMGLVANGDFARIVILTLDSKYKDCFNIYEYRGGENIVINKEKWLTNAIRSVTENLKLSETEKLQKISDLYAEYDYYKNEE